MASVFAAYQQTWGSTFISAFVLMQQLQLLFPDAPEISFLNWTLFAIPLGVMIIAFVWIYFAYLADLRWNVFSKKPPSPSMSTLRLDTQIFAVQYQQLGPISSEEILIGLSMVVMILLWYVPIGHFITPSMHEPGFVAMAAHMCEKNGV